MIIYKITNKINGKIYIGQTIRPLIQRWNRHCCQSTVSAISHAIKKYGKHNFDIAIVSRARTINELNHREALSIRLFNSLSPNGYNLEMGGKNKLISDETRLKQSLAHIGLKYNRVRKPKSKKKTSSWINPQKGQPKRAESNIKNAITHGAKPFIMKNINGEIIWSGLIQSECAKKFNLSVGNINGCLSGKRKQHKGYTFTFEAVNG